MEQKTDDIKRTGEIEEFTNVYIIHPISSWLVPKFIKLNITPNMVSSFGMVCGLMAGVCYYNYQTPIFAALGFLLMFMWHVFDGADGQLARATKNFSEIGKVIDGVCDLCHIYQRLCWYITGPKPDCRQSNLVSQHFCRSLPCYTVRRL